MASSTSSFDGFEGVDGFKAFKGFKESDGFKGGQDLEDNRALAWNEGCGPVRRAMWYLPALSLEEGQWAQSGVQQT